MKIAKITTLFLTVFLTSICAHASYNISYEGGDAPFFLNGKVNRKKADQIVTLKIENINGVVYLGQTQTDADGEYGFVFELDDYGDAEISVYENKTLVSQPGDDAIYKSTSSEILFALADVNQNGVSAIENHFKVLQVKESEFLDLKNEQILKNHIEQKNFLILSDFLSSYSRAKLLISINRSNSSEEIKEYINKIGCTEELSATNAGNSYIKFTDTERNSICEMLIDANINTVDELVEAINEQVILQKLKEVKNYNEKIDVLEQNNDYLKLNFIQAKKLGSYYIEFKHDLVKKDISTIEKIRTEFAALLNEYNNKPTNSNGSGDGGGGSSFAKNEVVSVSSDFVNTSNKTTGFTDMDGYEWASDAVNELSQKGIVNGKSDKTFAPSDNITRAEFVKLIVRALNLEQYSSGKTYELYDVNNRDWFYDDVQIAYGLGIINGTGEKTFSPDNNITRQDMAVICIRALKCVGLETNGNKTITSLTDLDNSSQYAKEYIDKALSLGILNGYNNKFHPHDSANRAQAAVLIKNIITQILK